MNEKELQAFAREAAKTIKTQEDLANFQKMLTKITIETALNAELDEHLAMKSTRPTATPTVAMATPARPSSPTKVKSK